MKKLIHSMLFLCTLFSVRAQEKVFIPEPGEGISFNTSSLMIVGANASYLPSWRANSQEVQLLREQHIGLSHLELPTELDIADTSIMEMYM